MPHDAPDRVYSKRATFTNPLRPKREVLKNVPADGITLFRNSIQRQIESGRTNMTYDTGYLHVHGSFSPRWKNVRTELNEQKHEKHHFCWLVPPFISDVGLILRVSNLF